MQLLIVNRAQPCVIFVHFVVSRLLGFIDSFRRLYRMGVDSVLGKMAKKEFAVLLLICVLTGVCISIVQSLTVSCKRYATFESMQYMYSRETLLSLRHARVDNAGALDLHSAFPELRATGKRGRRGGSRLKIRRPALRSVFPDDQVNIGTGCSAFPLRGERPRRLPRPRCLTVIRPDADMSPSSSLPWVTSTPGRVALRRHVPLPVFPGSRQRLVVSLSVVICHYQSSPVNAWSCRGKEDDIADLIGEENLDILFVTETRLCAVGDASTMRQMTPDGYKLISFPREGGGRGLVPLDLQSPCCSPFPGSVSYEGVQFSLPPFSASTGLRRVRKNRLTAAMFLSEFDDRLDVVQCNAPGGLECPLGPA